MPQDDPPQNRERQDKREQPNQRVTHGASNPALDEAVHGLASRSPHLSARRVLSFGQTIGVTVLIGLLIGLALVVPMAAIGLGTALLTLPFAVIVGLRLMAFLQLFRNQQYSASSQREPALSSDAGNDILPVYTVLCPLYREGPVVAQLVAALAQFDYPADRLDIRLLVEGDDAETRGVLDALALPPQVSVIIVPPCAPRTKPKALTYALANATGRYVAIYDAEDLPAPDQLRRAREVFETQPPWPSRPVGCVQARLRIHNAGQSFLSGQFALEYMALFDGLLPAIVALRLPVPLSGTSNHFPVEVLHAIGAWDPYNVTEDADLGLRLARSGYRTALLASDTYEEAPITFGNWLGQRTRWLKGWMQTYAVHNRQPMTTLRQLGLWRWFGFHLVFGGFLLSALVHPWFYALLASEMARGTFLAPPETTIGQWLVLIAGINVGLGYLSAIVLAAGAALRNGQPGLALQAIAIPLTWLMISFAAYRALGQLIAAPHVWEKTTHGFAPKSGGSRIIKG